MRACVYALYRSSRIILRYNRDNNKSFWAALQMEEAGASHVGKPKGLPPVVQPKPKPSRSSVSSLVIVRSDGTIAENEGDGSNDEEVYRSAVRADSRVSRIVYALFVVCLDLCCWWLCWCICWRHPCVDECARMCDVWVCNGLWYPAPQV